MLPARPDAFSLDDLCCVLVVVFVRAFESMEKCNIVYTSQRFSTDPFERTDLARGNLLRNAIATPNPATTTTSVADAASPARELYTPIE